MDDTAAFRRSSEAFVERARQIGPDQWTASTPCAEWDVRALVNHVAGEWLWVDELMAGRTIAEVGDRLNGDILGADPMATLLRAQRAATSAFEDPGAMDRTVHLSFGDMPASGYAKQMAVDGVIHSWDVARAVGKGETLDPELVQLAWDDLSEHAEEWRAGGAFAEAKEPADDSLQAKLIALTGR